MTEPTQEMVRAACRAIEDYHADGADDFEESIEVALRAALDYEPLAAVAARARCARMNHEICQILGNALGYPWLKDDQKNFPGATEADGVCVGDHVAESIAVEAAKEIERLQARVSELERRAAGSA